MKPIAHIENNFPTKFGIPRQSGRVEAMKARIVFEPEYRNADACRGLEEFSHIWLIWEFSEAKRTKWSPTVRPPRLGGNVRKGVFATRSPFRPNSIGLSCVKLTKVSLDEPDSPVITVSWLRGMSRAMFLRLWVRAPRIRMASIGKSGLGQPVNIRLFRPSPQYDSWLLLITTR